MWYTHISDMIQPLKIRNSDICDHVDGPGGHYAKDVKSQTEKANTI